MRDALINVGPLKDFAYGLRTNSDPNAAGIAKQSNYELVIFMTLYLSIVGYNYMSTFSFVLAWSNVYM